MCTFDQLLVLLVVPVHWCNADAWRWWKISCALAGMLDVQQIFGRAGRPQYEDTGLGVLACRYLWQFLLAVELAHLVLLKQEVCFFRAPHCLPTSMLMQGTACINAISYGFGPCLLSGIGSLTIVACVGIIITQHAQLSHYLGMLTHQAAIESKFIDNLTDNLNAEIVLGAPWLHMNGPFLA